MILVCEHLSGKARNSRQEKSCSSIFLDEILTLKKLICGTKERFYTFVPLAIPCKLSF